MVRSLNVGIRQLQRMTSRLIAEVQDGLHLVVTNHGRPVAVVVPLARAQAWVLHERSIFDPKTESEATEHLSWLVEGSIQIANGAKERFASLPQQIQTRLVRRLARLRMIGAIGRVVVREGQVWALADLDGEDQAVALLALGRRTELERWLWAGDTASLASAIGQPM